MIQSVKIATILPYKENYTFQKAQAAAIWVCDFFKYSKFKNTNFIFGNTKGNDYLTKNYINPSDTQRSIRAYEIKLFTKKSMYNWFKNTKSSYENNIFFKIYIDYPRKELLERISLRAKEMVSSGAIKEVKEFNKIRISKSKSASKAIGINEIREFITKKIEINEVIEQISIKTRQYAKRQSTWARGNMSDWIKINPNGLNKFLKKI